ncbi:hypothetical protein PF007_g3289 [Phytophthora fragariae]|uniref:Uncharacterized protein n=1 Tax=Phytophthora fragariae TaxID=53985 RepID=A0A6A3TMW3_9STRA|nr:hypothetical protein PF003_g19560 [Phytophthora fragariae]KAE9010848.1 hypothetical protein PF011_g9634 [Phytophthora fragariae]KAE9133524.1 hypothetical protein PF007_g3289 [Phytophthora fragariae]KAE9310241.1 hypothetical protein PF001_g10292 [Phytophthora fragariae]
MDITSPTAFNVAVAVFCALAAAFLLSKLSTAVRGGPSVFLQVVLMALVAIQFFYLYQASRHQLQELR